MNITIITGASSGIGREFAVQLDGLFSNMDEIWLVARRKERLEELRCRLKTRCRIIDMDITDPVYMRQFSEILKIARPRICMLVNCAGFGLMGAVDMLSLEEQLSMIDLNCRALTDMTYRCLPYMRKMAVLSSWHPVLRFCPRKILQCMRLRNPTCSVSPGRCMRN